MSSLVSHLVFWGIVNYMKNYWSWYHAKRASTIKLVVHYSQYNYWYCFLPWVWGMKLPLAKEQNSRLCAWPGQGAKLQKITWFPFGNPPLKIGFPKLFQAFWIEEENLKLTLLSFQSEVLIKKIGFPTVFLGVLESRKPSNAAPCWMYSFWFIVLWK